MSTTDSILKHVALSIRQLAAETGFARDTVRKRLDAADVKSCGKRGGYPVFRLRDVLPALYFGQEETFDPDKLRPTDRHAWYKAEREKLHIQVERGDLIPAIEVESRYGGRNKMVAQYLETALDVVERDAGLTPQQAERLERHLDDLRRTLHDLMNEDDDDVDSADEVSA